MYFILLYIISPYFCSIVEDSDPAVRVNQSLQGLFHYYWTSDPEAKTIKFFFACGQIGGGGSPYKWNKCSCNDPTACVNCYRWWDAVALESVATHGIYTNNTEYAEIADIIFAHSPYNSEWNAHTTQLCTFIDDFTWYGIAYLRVYEWLKVNMSIFVLKYEPLLLGS